MDEVKLLPSLLADFEHPAVVSSIKFLRDRYQRAKCDSEAVSDCVNCNTMFLIGTIERARKAIEATRPTLVTDELVERAWREGFQSARECLSDDEAFTLTEDVEEDCWRDSKTRAALIPLAEEL